MDGLVNVAHYVFLGFAVLLLVRTALSWLPEKIRTKAGPRHVQTGAVKVTEPAVNRLRQFGWLRPVAFFDLAPMAALMLALAVVELT